jgi:hypothetical protein
MKRTMASGLSLLALLQTKQLKETEVNVAARERKSGPSRYLWPAHKRFCVPWIASHSRHQSRI